MTRQTASNQAGLYRFDAVDLGPYNAVFPRGSNRHADLFNDVSGAAGDATSQFFPVPLGNGRPDLEFGSLPFPYAQTRTDRQWLTRLGHKLGERGQLSLRYATDRDFRPVGGETPSFAGSFTGRFLRLHRSTIVNVSRIRELRPWFHGRLQGAAHQRTRADLES